jgi:heat shock protein HslJ
MRARRSLVRLAALVAIVAPASCARSTAGRAPAAPAKSTTELTAAAAPTTPTDGLFRYVADEATFQDCATGKSYQVVMDADYMSTQYAYTSAAVREPGAPMMIKALVHVVETPHVGDRERHPMVVIDRLVQASNDTSTCPAASFGPSSIATHRWRLVELDGQPVAEDATQKWPRPTIVLNARDQTFAGFSGCDDLHGRWTTPDGPGDRGRLDLAGVVAVPRGCTPSQRDDALVRALEQTQRFEVTGSRLVLYDDKGPRARFEAQED